MTTLSTRHFRGGLLLGGALAVALFAAMPLTAAQAGDTNGMRQQPNIYAPGWSPATNSVQPNNVVRR